MISLSAKEYRIDLIWQCPKCKKTVTSCIDEPIENGWPLCTCSKEPFPEMNLVTYLLSNNNIE